MKIEATLYDVKDGMAKAYERWAERTGYNITDKTMFACTKIEISKEVDDYFWKYYKDKARKDNPLISDDEIKTSIAMIMLNYGAKRNENLGSWEVDIQEGFAYESEE